MRPNTPITEMDTRLIDRNTRICVSTLFSVTQLSNLCEPLERCLDCEFYRVQVSWNHFLVRWYHFTSSPQKSISPLLQRKWFSLSLLILRWILDCANMYNIFIQFDLFIYAFVCMYKVYTYILLIQILSRTDLWTNLQYVVKKLNKLIDY